MEIIITLSFSEIEWKKAIAKGWNVRFNEKLTHNDISEVSNKEDILNAIPYLDWETIDVEVNQD